MRIELKKDPSGKTVKVAERIFVVSYFHGQSSCEFYTEKTEAQQRHIKLGKGNLYEILWSEAEQEYLIGNIL